MHFVVIDWWKFLPALALLLPPVAWFEGPRVHFREIDRDWDRHWPQITSLWVHYFDFARAALGTWLLLDSLQLVANAQGAAKYGPLLVQGVVRLLAVWLQTVWCKEPDSVNAPFAFIAGLMIAGVAPLAAAIALGLAIPLAAGARAPAIYFPVLSTAFVTAAALFGGKALLVKAVVGALAPFIPWLWWLLFNRTLVIPYRSQHAGRSAPPLATVAR